MQTKFATMPPTRSARSIEGGEAPDGSIWTHAAQAATQGSLSQTQVCLDAGGPVWALDIMPTAHLDDTAHG